MSQIRRPARLAPLALRALPAALALIGLWPAAGGAAVHLWTGAGSANWSDAANWEGGLPPSGADTELLLNSATRSATFNDIAGGFVLNRLTLGASAAAPVLTGQALSFQGPGAALRMLSDAGHGQIKNALVLGSSLDVAGGPSLASQLFLQGAISGSGGLHLSSGTTVISSNANSWTGLTRIEAGATLGTAFSALNNSTRVEVAAGGELQLIGPGGPNPATVVNAPIQLGGLLSSSAPQILVFGQFAPGAYVNSTVTLSDQARIHAFNGSSLVLAGTVDRAGHRLTLDTAGSGNQVLLSKALAGHGDVQLTPNGGTLRLGAVLGNGDIVVNGQAGTVELGTLGSDGGSGRLQVAFDPQSLGGSVTMKGVISGSRELQLSGGTLDLGALAHSFSGTVTMSGTGMLRAANSASLGAAANLLRFEQGGTLDLFGRNGSLGHNIVTTGGTASVLVGASVNRSITSTISGDGGIAFNDFSGGQSLVTLSGHNSFSGGLGVGSGVVLSFASDDNLGAAGGRIELSGSLSVPAGYTLNRAMTVAGFKAGFGAGQAGLYTLAGELSGDGRLALGGTAPGTFFQLTGNNSSFSGGVLVHGNPGTDTAVLLLASDAQLGAATGVLDLGRANGGLAPRPGTLRAMADLNIAATRSTSFRSMTVDTNGFDVVFNQAIDGLGLTKAGAGTWTLNTANANNSADNRVDVLQGTLALGALEALGTRSLVSVAAGAQLVLGGQQLTITALDSAAGSRVDLGAGGTLRPLFGTLDGALEGQGSLVVGRAGFSPGAVTLNGANGFIGAVEVTNGSRLTLGHAQALGAAGNLIRLDEGSLEVTQRLAMPLRISAGTNLQIGAGGAGFVANGQSIIVESLLVGSAPLRIQGGSSPGSAEVFDVRLAHRHNSFTGDLVLGDPQGFGSAVLGITADGSLGAAGNRLILGKSFYDGESTRSAQGGLRAWDSLTLAATRSVLLDGQAGDTAGFIDTNGHTLVVAGSIGELASNLGLLKTGEGTLVLKGVQGYTGLTRVEAGALGGSGEVEQLQVQSAVLAPGESPGLFSVRRDLSFSSAALLAMELGGTVRGSSHDALNVGGLLDLGQDTTLRLSFVNGFSAQAGQQFDLLDWGSLQGEFSAIDTSGLRLAAGTQLDISRLYVDGVISVSAVPEPGQWALLLAGLGLLALRRASELCCASPAS